MLIFSIICLLVSLLLIQNAIRMYRHSKKEQKNFISDYFVEFSIAGLMMLVSIGGFIKYFYF